MKKLQIEFVKYWLADDLDAMASIIRHMPADKKRANIYVKFMRKDIKALGTEIKHLKALLKGLGVK